MRIRMLLGLTVTLTLLSLAVARAGEVRGTVFGPDDRGLADVRVVLTGPGDETQQTTTDTQGRYAFTDLGAGRYTVVAGKRGFTVQRQSVALAGAAQNRGVSFRLQPWSAMPWSLTGTVTREGDGRPVPGAKVMLMREAMPGRSDPAGEAATDEEGFFAFTELKRGRYALSVSAPRYPPASKSGILLREATDRPAADITLVVPPPETLPGEVELQAVQADGQPVVRTEILVSLEGEAARTSVPWGNEIQLRRVREQHDLGGGRARMQVEVTATTGDDGRVRFTLPPGAWKVGARAPGMAAKPQSVTLAPDGKAQAGPFRMDPVPEAPTPPLPEPVQPRGVLRGVVLRPDGTPLADTGIYLFIAQGQGEGNPWDRENRDLTQAYTTTNAVGVFERTALTPGNVLVAVKTRGFAESEPVRALIPGKGTVDVRLTLPGPSLKAAGRAIGPDGKPLVAARVFAYRAIGRWQDARFWDAIERLWLGGQQQDGGPWPFDTPLDAVKPGVIPGLLQHGLSYAETDAEGRFVLTELDTGVYHFGAMAPGLVKTAREKVVLKGDAAPPDLAFSLQALGGFEGVIALPDGRPLADAEVKLSHLRQGGEQQRWRDATVRTGLDGRYRVEGMEPGSYQVRAKAAGHPTAGRDPVAVASGKSTPGIDFRLVEGLTLRGRVLKPDGTPAAGASVRYALREAIPMEAPATVAGADGGFTLTGLPPGSGTYSARLAPFAPTASQVTLPQAAGAVLEIRLALAATVKGRILDEDGKPLADAYVAWYPVRAAAAPDHDGRTDTRTDAAGEFELTGVTPGTATISASKPEYRHVQETREVAAGAVITLDLRMAKLRYGRLRGRLLGTDGKPAVGVTLRAYTEGASQATAATDGDGVFRLERVAAGKVHLMLEARALAGQQTQVEVKPDEETVVPEIRLAATGSIECSLKGLENLTGKSPAMLIAFPEAEDPEGKPVPASAAVRLYLRSRQDVLRGLPDAAGKPSGAVDLTAFGTGGVTLLVYPQGTRLPFNSFEGSGPPSGQAAGNSGTLPRVPVGRCRVRAGLDHERGGAVLTPGVSVVVTADKTSRAEIPLVPGGKLAARVVGAPAKAGEMPLWLFRRESLELMAVSGLRPDGTLALSGLAPGDYLACLWNRDSVGLWQPFAIRAGETTELTLTPAKGVPLRGRVEGARVKEMHICAESATSFDGGEVAEDGTFVIEHLLPGTYTLRLWARDQERIVTLANVQVGERGAEGVVVKWE